MIVLHLVSPPHYPVKEKAEEEEADVHDGNDDRVDDKAPEGKVIVLREGEEGEIAEGDIKVEHIEVVDRRRIAAPIAVDDRTRDKTKKEVRRKPEKEGAERAEVHTAEDAQSRQECGDHKDEGVLIKEVHVVEAGPTGAEVRTQKGDDGAHSVGKEGEVEEFFPLKDDSDKEEVGGDVAKLERQAPQRDARKVEGIVMEEQRQNEKEAKRIPLTVRAEAEEVVEPQCHKKRDTEPDEVVGRERWRLGLHVAKECLGGVARHHRDRNARRAEEEVPPLGEGCHAEHVPLTHVEEDRQSYGKRQLKDKVGRPPAVAPVEARGRGVREVRHEVVKEEDGGDGKGERDVPRNVAKSP